MPTVSTMMPDSAPAATRMFTSSHVSHQPPITEGSHSASFSTLSRETLKAWLDEAQSAGQPEPILGERRHPRFLWVMYVEVMKIGNAAEKSPCRIRDISEGGIGLFCHQKWSTEEPVRICRPNQRGQHVDGKVVHCTQTVGGFLVGVEVA